MLFYNSLHPSNTHLSWSLCLHFPLVLQCSSIFSLIPSLGPNLKNSTVLAFTWWGLTCPLCLLYCPYSCGLVPSMVFSRYCKSNTTNFFFPIQHNFSGVVCWLRENRAVYLAYHCKETFLYFQYGLFKNVFFYFNRKQMIWRELRVCFNKQTN